MRWKLEIQEEMQQYENIKGIKIRHDRYSDEKNEAMVCYITQKEAEEAISQLNKKTEWHAKIYQSNYEEFEENLKSNYEEKKTKENNNNAESTSNETYNERQNHQSKKGIDKWKEEMDILKCDISQIK